MFSASGAVLGVSKLPCRAVQAVAGRRDKHLFFVGTTSLVAENEVHLVEYDDDSNTLKTRAVLAHPNEIWDLAPHPTRADLLFTCADSGTERVGTLFRTAATDRANDGDGALGGTCDLEAVATLPAEPRALRRVLWHPADEDEDEDFDGGASGGEGAARAATERFASVHDGLVRLWDLTGSRLDAIGECTFQEEDLQSFSAGWDPHHTNQLSVGLGGNIETVDLRSMSVVQRVESAHESAVLDLDYNPNKPYYVASAGDDRRLKVWDLRKPGLPVKVVIAHGHWTTRARFNPWHDQLLLTAGSDAMVNLYRLSSISSAPLLELEADEGHEGRPNGAAGSADPASGSETADALVKSYEDHSESVYGTAWGAGDAWVFATLSYDGKLAVNHVPSAEKYKILL